MFSPVEESWQKYHFVRDTALILKKP